MLPISIRPYNKIGDEAFLFSTWMKSYSDSVRGCPLPIYHIGQRNRMIRLLNRHDTLVYIACDRETPELIYGYIVVGMPNCLHWIYVKSDYRNAGVGKQLLNLLNWQAPVFYTHKANAIWIEQKIKGNSQYDTLIYNPYILEEESQ